MFNELLNYVCAHVSVELLHARVLVWNSWCIKYAPRLISIYRWCSDEHEMSLISLSISHQYSVEMAVADEA